MGQTLRTWEQVHIPGLGVCSITNYGSHVSRLEIEVYTSDLEEFAQRLVPISCGACNSDNEEALEGDYKCVTCREDEVHFSADLAQIVRGAS